jgi:hypothetical protein
MYGFILLAVDYYTLFLLSLNLTIYNFYIEIIKKIKIINSLQKYIKL